MILLQVNNLNKYFGAELILSNIKLEVQSNERIALVGRNGAGKSTLLKIISGQLSSDGGEIIKPNHISIGYLAQDTGLESNSTIWDEMLTVFKDLRVKEKQLRDLEVKMGDPKNLENQTTYEKLLKDYDQLQVEFKEQGGYQYEADIRTVLHGLNFKNFDYSTPINVLSGGQKTRLALGKLLLMKPELLILDEPTNHLDIDTLTWLEQYLQNYPGSILIVSHDRYFLDKLVTKVYEISRNKSTRFVGNYSSYLIKKAEQFDQELKDYEKQQTEVAKLKEFIQKNIARASTTKRAQSRRKSLEKMSMMDRPQGLEKSASFSFDIDRQSGNDVLKAKDISIAYENQEPIIRDTDFSLSRGDSVALVGPNGIGKSTLLKAIHNKISLYSGDFQFGSNVSIGYYDQEQRELTPNKTVLKELWDDYPLMNEKDIRTVLGNFLFSGDDVLKQINELSGGEKARVSLAKLMLKKSNFLILDEPTNHLDLDSKEVLENALIDYPGTILFVSHDRYFINRIATKVFELSTTGITEYLGDYDYYLQKKAELIELGNIDEESNKEANKEDQQDKVNYEQDKEAKRKERKRQRQLEQLETDIEKLEKEIAEREELLCDPQIFQDFEKSTEINNELESLNEKMEALMAEWEELESQ